MPQTNDVTLPRSYTALFPDRCIRCGVPNPQSRVPISDYSDGRLSHLIWTFWAKFEVQAPACRTCRRSMLLYVWLYRLLILATMVLIYFAGSHYARAFRSPIGELVFIGIGLLFCIPLELVLYFLPPAFYLSAGAKTVDYCFRDLEYALEFADLNAEHVIHEEDEDE